jgi:hypothetical protein
MILLVVAAPLEVGAYHSEERLDTVGEVVDAAMADGRTGMEVVVHEPERDRHQEHRDSEEAPVVAGRANEGGGDMAMAEAGRAEADAIAGEVVGEDHPTVVALAADNTSIMRPAG